MRGSVLQKSSAQLGELLDAPVLRRKSVGKTYKSYIARGNGTEQPVIEISVDKSYEETKRIDKNMSKLRKGIYVSLCRERKQQSMGLRRPHCDSRRTSCANDLGGSGRENIKFP
eukprot:TRINITY_DN2092_c0_g1_i1.p3 TRINITY_DN2092_c0_g1~~TRINITY_DN2092_c0_g1_i1.p3  ORF type:complete len:114 (+),score=2.04 TRINITY_DN2092_c0_g1_i1:1253-1594(+)